MCSFANVFGLVLQIIKHTLRVRWLGHCTSYNVRSTMYVVQYTSYNVHRIMYVVQGTWYNVRRTMYVVQGM